MRIPIIALADNLLWTRSGVVWAVWRLQGVEYRYTSSKKQQQALMAHQALLRALRGEALLYSVCSDRDPVSVVERMLEGVDVAEHPQWAEEVVLTLDQLAGMQIGERSFWIAVPLAVNDPVNRVRGAAYSAESSLRDSLALPRRFPSTSTLEKARKSAHLIGQSLPFPFRPRAATPAETAWLFGHAQQRGLGVDGAVPSAGSPLDEVSFQRPTVIPEPLLDEGAQSDTSSLGRINPFKRRYVKVTSALTEEPSYQALLALTGGPKGGWSTPGVEWLAKLDEFPFAVDWSLRLQISSGKVVQQRNKKAVNELNDQMKQQDGDQSPFGGGAHLKDVAEALQSYAASLNLSEKEVEVQATVIAAVAGPSAEDARWQAEQIKSVYGSSEFVFDPILGGQEELWWAMLPGSPTTSLVRELAQITTSREFATAMPLTDAELGGRSGSLIATNISTGREVPVCHSIAALIRENKSGSIGIVGEPGGGKSVFMKGILGDNIDQGARAFIIDRTVLREYAVFAKSLLPDDTAIVDLLNPELSLDPIRMLGPEAGAKHVFSLMAMMLGVRPRDPMGIELASLLSPKNIAELGVRSMDDLRRITAAGERDSVRAHLNGIMNVIADRDFGRVLFDPSLPPADLSRRAVIALTAGLRLPSDASLNAAHLFNDLPMEAIAGRAYYAYLAGLAREYCFADSKQLAIFGVDEASHISISEEGRGYLNEFQLDGRKHFACAIVASQTEEHLGNEDGRRMIPTRILFRHGDSSLARRSVAWFMGEDNEERALSGDDIDLDESARDIARILVEDTSPLDETGETPPHRRGEGFLRDPQGRVGKVRFMLPSRAERRQAVLTTAGGAA
ncbi:ATP-binding protein [Pseudoclavibacter sp. AY1H1]|uniref:ATP-binding protein n=1 Tax=Pseudoclavibacter sp. AY1H1 TaxID=2080584 RepID=UPI000CE86BA3|nr:ATP-binding protein [Pseudoclavibacter sp. AY1H1]PPF32627.1 ATP-binding protein [Pseudoclavibacter sp. AY1H1]